MSFVGGSISQAAAISGADARLSAVEALAGSKVATVDYNAKMAMLDAKDALHDSMIDSKVAIAAYEAKMTVLDAHDVAIEARALALEGRATAVEARATALETDLANRVQAEIDAKVATTTFDALASELRNADSALSAALATKVAATVQSGVDAAQDAIIGLKKNAADVDAKDAEHDGKLAALVEFVRVMLKTYTITLPTGGSYAWTGAAQNISLEAAGGGGSTGATGGSGGGGGTPPPSGDYAITINSAANGQINITSTQAFAAYSVSLIEVVDGVPNLSMAMGLNGNNSTVAVGTLTFEAGFIQAYNAGKVICLYAMPAGRFPWDPLSVYGVRVSANFTL
jgi:hypothetical protein